MGRYILFIVSIIFFSCGGSTPEGQLPILGNRDVVDGKTIYHTVPAFSYTNQYGENITPETFANEAYIVDYFFTSCPTICPKVKQQQLRLYDKYKDHPKLSFLSVSIDTKYDTQERLANFAQRLDIEKGNWHFVTGDKDMIYDNANGFFHVAMENEEAPGGYDHDGKLVLIDKNHHIRGFCDGLIPEEVDRFFGDIDNLLNEHK